MTNKRETDDTHVDAANQMPASENYRFFSHTACEFYPCHDLPKGELNCLFCFCPLYSLGERCGGNFTFVGERGDVKDCSACTLPHRRENYDYIMRKLAEAANR